MQKEWEAERRVLEEEAVDSIRFRKACNESSYLPSSPEHARVIAHAVATGVVDQVCKDSLKRTWDPPPQPIDPTPPKDTPPGSPKAGLGFFSAVDMHSTATDWLRSSPDPKNQPEPLSPLQVSQVNNIVESQILP